jgi:hypothetical protein
VELVNQLDSADDVRVELVELLGRHPQLKDRPSTRLLQRIPAQEGGLDLEAGDEGSPTVSAAARQRPVLIAGSAAPFTR